MYGLFKGMVLILVLISLASCGQSDIAFIEKEVEKRVEVERTQDFEGVYLLPNNSYIELIAASDGDVTFDTSYQSIVSQNHNGSYGTHPTVSGKHEVHNSKIRWGLDVDYRTSSQYDLEEDGGSRDITGRHYTVYELTLKDDGISLKITIYDGTRNNNLNDIILERTLESI